MDTPCDSDDWRRAQGPGLTRHVTDRSVLAMIRRPDLLGHDRAPTGRAERDLIGAWSRIPSLSCPPSRLVRATTAAPRRWEGWRLDTIAHQRPTVTVGVDTHGEVHVAAVLDVIGRLLGVREVRACPSGYAELVGLAESFGPIERVGVEGTGSYGAGLAPLPHHARLHRGRGRPTRPQDASVQGQVRSHRRRGCGEDGARGQGHGGAQERRRGG